MMMVKFIPGILKSLWIAARIPVGLDYLACPALPGLDVSCHAASCHVTLRSHAIIQGRFLGLCLKIDKTPQNVKQGESSKRRPPLTNKKHLEKFYKAAHVFCWLRHELKVSQCLSVRPSVRHIML